MIVAGWRVVVTNVSDFLFQGGGPEPATAALTWNRGSAPALYQRATELAGPDPVGATGYLRQAIARNAADAPAYAVLARIFEASGNFGTASHLMETVARLAPQWVDIQLEVGAFWMRRHDPARAMPHLDVALTYGGSVRSELFPLLLQLAEDPEARTLTFEGPLRKQLHWWPDFFAYAAAQARSVETLRALASLQGTGPNKVTPSGRRVYLDRLQRDGLWVDAYIAWLNGLTREQSKLIGNLFNGDFEENPTSSGFDWVVTPAPQVVIETAGTYGAAGHKALRVLFKGPRIQFQHLRQSLMLGPGDYLLRGRVRADNLETPEGVRWSIACLNQPTSLATSEAFRGTSHWQHFAVPFNVPQGCPVQTIRLELAGRTSLDFVAKGTIWFDDMTISRKRLD